MSAPAAVAPAKSAAYGVMGDLLPDGTRLIRSMPLSAEQQAQFSADRHLLAWARVQQVRARALNLVGRAAIVVLGLVLGYLVFAQMIDLVLAGVLALFLLVSPELLSRRSAAHQRRHTALFDGLGVTRMLVEQAVPGVRGLSSSERHALYADLLSGGTIDAAGRRVAMAQAADGSLELRVATAASAAA